MWEFIFTNEGELKTMRLAHDNQFSKPFFVYKNGFLTVSFLDTHRNDFKVVRASQGSNVKKCPNRLLNL